VEENETESGIYFSVFQKIEGRYQCIRDTWNTTTEEENGDEAE
jgi:hypothetical protein